MDTPRATPRPPGPVSSDWPRRVHGPYRVSTCSIRPARVWKLYRRSDPVATWPARRRVTWPRASTSWVARFATSSSAAMVSSPCLARACPRATRTGAAWASARTRIAPRAPHRVLLPRRRRRSPPIPGCRTVASTVPPHRPLGPGPGGAPLWPPGTRGCGPPPRDPPNAHASPGPAAPRPRRSRGSLRLPDQGTDLGVAAEGLLHHRLRAGERLGGPPLRPHDQDRLGIAGPDQGPAVGELDPHPVDIDDLEAAAELPGDLLHHLKLAAVRAGDPDLRGGVVPGDLGHQVRELPPAPGQEPEQPARGVQRVVVTVVPVGKKRAPRHPPGKPRARPPHRGFDEGGAGP